MGVLLKIGSTCQEVAEAISLALGIDVEIVDTNLIRIAVTGKYSGYIGKPLFTGATGYKYAIDNSVPYLIKQPGQDKICKGCDFDKNCLYKIAAYAPINHKEKTVGVISLVAFDEEKRDKITNNIKGNMDFVLKMANLLSAKIRETEMHDEIIGMASQLNTIFQKVDQGMISIDMSGNILRVNPTAAKMLEIKSTDQNENLFNYLIEKPQLTNQILEEEIMVKGKKTKTRFLTKWIPMEQGRTPWGYVVLIKDYREEKKSVNRFLGGYKTVTVDDIIGKSKIITEFKEMILKIASSESTVLITGETGTGKELFARAIHFHSHRSNGPFVVVNCSALPETLIESELFGYEKGAFTGAGKLGKPGKFEMADGGTIYLDEIQSLPLYLQPKLLRVLQEREVERVGGKDTIPLDVRIITSSNKNLGEMVNMGNFRRDLYHRINVLPLEVPSLRLREDDIILLAEYFLKRYSKQIKRELKGFDKEVIDFFRTYPWPGNVRELQNTVEYCVNFEEGDLITRGSLPNTLINNSITAEESLINLKDNEIESIMKALNYYGWHDEGKLRAAKSLGISRATIYRKIKKYQLDMSK
jgi:transcriptional regulator with PAS, ATPase and Fis domain